MKTISFIMPTYNRADYISESIESIFNEMETGDDLTVIDDGSTDNTKEIIDKYGSRVQYVKQENSGKSVALNRGLSTTSGDYIWICDDDDILRPGTGSKLRKILNKSDADMVFGRYTRFKNIEKNKIDMGTGYWPDLSQGSLSRHILEDSFVMHNASLVRREAYNMLGPFDESFLRSQDYEMFVRLALNCKIKYLDEIIFEQRKHDGGRGPKNIIHKANESNIVWQKYDRAIFENLRDTVPISYFQGFFESDDQTLCERAGYLQRGCILARHGLWEDAIIDFCHAAEILPNKPLTSCERKVCRRAVSGKHGLFNLNDANVILSIKFLSKKSVTGNEIVYNMARGMLWRLKFNDKTQRLNTLLFLSKFKLASLQGLFFEKLSNSKGIETQICENINVHPVGS